MRNIKFGTVNLQRCMHGSPAFAYVNHINYSEIGFVITCSSQFTVSKYYI